MNPVIAMLIGVVVMMGLIIFTRMHAFPSLIISAILIGILSGIPLGESISTCLLYTSISYYKEAHHGTISNIFSNNLYGHS